MVNPSWTDAKLCIHGQHFSLQGISWWFMHICQGNATCFPCMQRVRVSRQTPNSFLHYNQGIHKYLVLLLYLCPSLKLPQMIQKISMFRKGFMELNVKNSIYAQALVFWLGMAKGKKWCKFKLFSHHGRKGSRISNQCMIEVPNFYMLFSTAE